MDQLISIPHDWAGWIQLTLAVLIGLSIRHLPSAIKQLVDLILGRKKQTADIDNANAENKRLVSEARTLDLQNVLSTSKAIASMVDSVELVTSRFERLQSERDHWEKRSKAWQTKCGILEGENALLNKNLEPFITVANPPKIEPLALLPKARFEEES